MIGIYKITNQITNEVYIGQSIHIEQRWEEHKREAKTNNSQALIYQAMRQYGINNFSFEILEECQPNEVLLNEREKYWISFYDSFHNGYNMTSGGQGNEGWIYNPETFFELWDEGYTTQQIAEKVGCSIQLVAMRLKGYKDFGRCSGHSRTYYNNKEANIHQYTLLGEYIQSFASIREAERALQVKHSDIISFCLSGKLKTGYNFQWKNYKQDKITPVASAHGKLVQCIETNELFPSTKDAAKAYNLKSHTNIVDCCHGRKKSAGKHPVTGEKLHWKYVEE